MTITVRMLTAQALAQLRALNAGVAGNATALNRASGAANAYGGALARMNLVKWGSQMQWIGRQLQTNFTLPIMLATGMAVKWALENEKAMVRVSKVYGDTRLSAQTVKNEVNALKGAMAALSSRFGIAQKDAINIAGDWAAAGASGIALAKATELTMRTMVLGEIEAKKATESLIAIQAQWGFNTQQLTATIEQLNVIENETGISLAGLIDGFARASGVARSAGLTTLYLGAALAALTPAAGTAAQAGNALKTIISRLLSPTQEANQVLREMGINTADLAWKSATADQRLQILATSFGKLSQAQKGVVSAVVASRYQINKFEVLMDALANTNSYYYRAVTQASNATRNHAQAEKELAAVLNSSPRRLQIMWQLFRNSAAEVGEHLVPTVLMLASALASAMRWFNNLNPSVRKFIISAALMLAVVGPLIRYIASLAQAIGILSAAAVFAGGKMVLFGRGLMAILLFPFTGVIALFGKMYAGIIALTVSFGVKMRAAMTAVTVAMTGPWGIAVAAIVAVFVIFYNDIKALFNSIVKFFQTGVRGIGSSASGLVRIFWSAVDSIRQAFFALPEGVQKALMAVVHMVAAAAKAVYKLFSYLNPFARHSPSLVDNVTAGMAEVGTQFGSVVPIIEAHLKQAYSSIKAFGAATRTMVDGVNMADLGNKRIEVGKVSPGALGMFDSLVGTLRILKGDISGFESQVTKQQAVVDAWKMSLDAANLTLDKQDFILQGLKDNLSGISDELDAAKSALQAFVDTPIQGERAMSDAIFANQMAQKRLRLEMMQIEDVVGPLGKLESKLQGLQGAMELVTGQREELRASGAGSEILQQYDAQVTALENQKQALDDAIAPLKNLQSEIDVLGRKAERLDLEQSLKFDPLRRQVDQLANSMKELPFAEILAGVIANKNKVNDLQRAYESANAAVKAQEIVVNQLKAARDIIQQSYDAEAMKLETIKNQYDKVKTAVSDVEGALNDAAQAARDFQQAQRGGAGADEFITPGLQNFRDAAGGDFPTEGGGFSVGREGGLGDQSALIEQFTKDMQANLDKSIKSLNPFEWIKDKWNDFTGWWSGTVVPWFKGLFGGISFDTSKFDGIINWFKGAGSTLNDFFSGISDLFKPAVDDITSAFGDLWDQIVKEVWPALQDLGKAFYDLWIAVKPIIGPLLTGLKYLLGFIVTVFFINIKNIITILIHVFNGFLGGVITVVKGIIKVFTGFIEFFTGLFTGDWRKMWQGIKDILTGIWTVVYGILKAALGAVYGFLKGFVENAVDLFKWLWNKSSDTISSMVSAIIAWIKSLPTKAIAALNTLISLVVSWAKAVWNAIQFFMLAGWNTFLSWLRLIPSNIYNTLVGVVNLVGNIARNAWSGFTSTARSMLDGMISWLTGIPGRAANALSSIGSAVANAVKSAYNAAAGFLNNNVINNVNKVTGVFGVKLPILPKFAKGGIVPGGYSSIDNQLIMARSGEGILIPEAVRDLGGPGAIDALNRSAGGKGGLRASLKDGLQHFADGGVVGWFKSNVVDRVSGWLASGTGFALEKLLKPAASAIKQIMPDGFTKDLMVGLINKWADSAKTWGANKDKTSGAELGAIPNLGGPGGNSIGAILSVAKRFYPGAMVSSGYRPGDPGFHGKGLAADIIGGGASGMARIAAGFFQISNRLIELIHSGGGGFFVKNGRRVGASYYAGDIPDHYNHVHVAANANALGFDKGGPLPVGYSMSYNGTGSPEWVSTAEEIVRITSGLTAGSIAARGLVGMTSLLTRMDARMARVEERMTSPKAGSINITINGDLVLPNIKNGNDAEEFVKNLEALARKSS